MALGRVCLGEAVCKYVTKHIGKDVDYDIVIKSQKFQSTINPNIGAWVLENGFSIETGGWDLICNPFSIP